ncbi:hypothetical protein [Aeromonas sp. 600948]|uniref:hypothetical protein n=1 Tax=Aeromonas sp. 600948 TaxID=2712034 RepID=UPI003BA171C6
MLQHIKKYYKGKCPHCSNIIEFHKVIFLVDNDRGEMISQCENCDGTFRIPSINPDESYIVSGAEKIRFLDYDIHEPTTYQDIHGLIEFDGKLDDLVVKYNTSTKSLYNCANCNSGLEVEAHSHFESIFEKMANQYYNYTVLDIKGYGYNPEKAIVAIHFNCQCGTPHIGIFYKDYNHNEFSSSDFNLGNIRGAKQLEDNIDGTYSKTECMEILKKILVRWELFHDKIYIISPFVGHQYIKEDNLLDIWFSILSQLSKNKAKIITRTASLNLFKKAISSAIMDYKTLNEYDLSVNLIDSAIPLQRSHAKIYCAVSEYGCEIIHGSANIAYGPSTEQITFKKFSSYTQLYDKFLKNLEINTIGSNVYLPNEIVRKKNDSNILFDELNGFNVKEIKKPDFFKDLL